MPIAILATGDEIIHGDTLNTNGQTIANILSSEGIPLGYHLACSDKVEHIVDCLRFLNVHHTIIIIIGGLGPTTDDLTRFALEKWTGQPLVQHPEALTHVEDRLKKAKVAMNQGNLQQCLFPASATLLPNPHGSALGCYVSQEKTTFILLPGPPRECLPMFNQYVLPKLQRTQHSNKQLLQWRIFGLAESEIAETLENALAHLDCQTGYRLDIPYIDFKVKCTSDLVAQVKRVIDPLLQPYNIATIAKKASQALHDKLITIEEPITILDEATGGVLQTLLDKPETTQNLYFHSEQPTKLVFHIQGLKEYWTQQPATGETNLTIHYSYDKQTGSESHTLPYRTPMVIYYAAEWLSFRLIHLINQLHQ